MVGRGPACRPSGGGDLQNARAPLDQFARDDEALDFGGAFPDAVDAQPAASGEVMELVDPSTGKVHRSAPRSGGADADAACAAAAAAYESWSLTTPAERQRALLRIADAMEGHADDLVAAEVGDTGKPAELFRSDELPAITDTFRYFAGAARDLPGAAASEYYNAGQDCTAPTRLLVHARVHDAFVAAFAAHTEKQRPGTDFGPLNSASQLASVEGMLSRLPDHAEIVTGGCRIQRPGYFHGATVVAGVRQADEIVQDEIFGPVVTVQRFADEDEALRLANDVRFGLAAGVWTADHDCAMRATRALHTGIVWVNTHGTTVSEMPHGGVKHSGYGSDLSMAGLLDYTQVKHVML